MTGLDRYGDSYLCACCVHSPCKCEGMKCGRIEYFPMLSFYTKIGYKRIVKKQTYDCLSTCRIMSLEHKELGEVVLEYIHHDKQCPALAQRNSLCASIAKNIDLGLYGDELREDVRILKS